MKTSAARWPRGWAGLLGSLLIACHSFAAEVLHLSFDDSSGTNAADSALSDGTLTPNDSVTLASGAHFAPGKSGTALELSSTSAPFQYGAFDLTSLRDMLTNAPGATFACWLMVPDTLWAASTNKDKGDLIFIGLPNAPASTRFNVQIRRQAAIRVLARCNDSESTSASIQTTTDMYRSNIWVHVACVANYAAKTLAIYTNGQAALKSTTVATWGSSPTVCSSVQYTNAALGANWPTMDEAFIGRIDEARFWNEPLSDAQIAALVSDSAVPLPVITQTIMAQGGIILRGTNGPAGGVYQVLCVTNAALPQDQWPAIATNSFDATGNFDWTNSLPLDTAQSFYRILVGGQLPLAPTAPSIITQPQDLSVTEGQNATFSVTASGTAPLSYQWLFNSTTLAGATASSVIINNAQTTNAGGYSAIISNNVGSVTSVVATLTVNPAPVAPSITTQPTNQTVLAGQSAVFSVAATGTAPLRYQWYRTNSPLANATNATLTIANAQATNAGGYYAIITNTAGTATGSVAALTVLLPPTITTQPQNQTVTVSNNAAFSVVATGTSPLRYQWYFNSNTPLADATNATYTINSVTSNNAGGYSAIVTNSYGAATSSVAVLTVNNSVTLVAGAYFVATNGSDSNPGTLASPFRTISKGLTTIGTSGTIYIRAGVYSQTSEMGLSKIGATNLSIRLWAYPGERPIIDNTGTTGGADGIGISGRNYHLRGIEQRFAAHNGIAITGLSNLVENCIVHGNTNTGIHITDSGSPPYPAYNVVSNCDSYLNYDPPVGGNADGFSAKWDLGPGNVFVGCRAWWNSDDGWDLWMGTSTVLIKDCWAFKNGTNYWSDPGFNGNGNGFKLGGNYVGTPHRVLRCVAFKNQKHGFDQNNNEDSQTLDNNTAWANKGKNYYMDHGTNSNPHIVRNNVSFAGVQGDTWRSGTIFTNNTWQVISSPSVNTSDFQSMDESVATAPRNADGSLPAWPFLRPVTGGRLIDRGVSVGQPYAGAAPDLGAFEVQ